LVVTVRLFQQDNTQQNYVLQEFWITVDRELNGQAVKYNHFELKNIAFDETKFPMLF